MTQNIHPYGELLGFIISIILNFLDKIAWKIPEMNYQVLDVLCCYTQTPKSSFYWSEKTIMNAQYWMLPSVVCCEKRLPSLLDNRNHMLISRRPGSGWGFTSQNEPWYSRREKSLCVNECRYKHMKRKPPFDSEHVLLHSGCGSLSSLMLLIYSSATPCCLAPIGFKRIRSRLNKRCVPERNGVLCTVGFIWK